MKFVDDDDEVRRFLVSALTFRHRAPQPS